MPVDQEINRANATLDMTEQEKNLYRHHVNNLYGDGKVRHPDGSISTVYQEVVTGPDGKFYNIPTVWNGKILDADAAYDRAAEKGWNYWPSYKNEDEADRRYMQMHKYMEQDVQDFLRATQHSE